MILLAWTVAAVLILSAFNMPAPAAVTEAWVHRYSNEVGNRTAEGFKAVFDSAGNVIAAQKVQSIVKKTLEEKPAHATYWSTRTMAKAVGISQKAVRRIWKAHGLKSHLSRTFKRSNDGSRDRGKENEGS